MSYMSLIFFMAAGLCLAGYVIPSYWFSSKRATKLMPALHIVPKDQKAYQFPALKVYSAKRPGMGFKRLEESNWLTIDSNYLPEHNLRITLLSNCRSNVIACLPASIPACYEVLELVVSFLTARFPKQFTISPSAAGPIIRNHVTGETFPVGLHPHCRNPLEIAALLAMEDFNILMKDPVSQEYSLQASATLFPAGWKLQERIGGSLARLHAPVPGWHANIGAHVNRYFDHLKPSNSMERSSLFIQTSHVLFQDRPETPAPPSLLKVEDIHVRRERQTFRRLEKSGTVLFTVRTFMTPLVQLGDEELGALRSHIWAWDQDTRNYKGWGAWGEKVEQWCETKLGKREEIKVEVEVEAAQGGGCPM